ncbi:hypothetical protein CRI94_07515 [Longibacter salinarum]|uniref:Aromatic hydrocarbon degradation protein n=2 Tax=Longibacter salinarum TaxID=1850348 RepID=A0A2A8CZ16_9BACT|nr:hypothetical protein CRI94_07515 [Longibacter salinarum]
MLAIMTVAPAAAQSSGDGSYYSRYGIGMLESFSSPQSEALGEGAFALRTTNYNPVANPALWADQIYTRATGALRVNVINTEGPSGNSAVLGAGSLEALQISFPLYTSRLGVGLALQPYSTSNYEVFRQGTVDVGVDEVTEAAYETAYEGRGGLYLFRSGLGGRVTENVRLGATVDVIFGSIKNTVRTRFPNIPAGTLAPSVSTVQTRVSGVTSTVGSQFSFPDVFQENDLLGFGASISLPATLSGDRTRTLDESLDADTVAVADGEMSLPYEIKAGVAYHMGQRWKFVADGVYAPWSTFDATFENSASSLGQFPLGGEGTLNDRWRLSAGSEFIPAGDDRFRSYFARTGYRLGTFVEQQYTTSDPGTNVYVMGATGGFSFPTAVPGTRVDLTFHVGTRGTSEPDLVQDLFYGGSLAISIGERWFTKPKLR